MRLGPIVTALSERHSLLREVLPALEGATPRNYPTAYIVPLKETPEPAESVGGIHEQKIRNRFAVEYMVKHAGQAAQGGPAQDLLEDCRDLTHLILCSGTVENTEMDFSGGHLMSFEPGFLVWRDEYVFDSYLRIAHAP